MLVVDDVKDFICDDDAVAGTETVRDIAGKVQSLLYKDERILAGSLGFYASI